MSEQRPEHFIIPDWPAPVTVRAVSTTRYGGISPPPYASFNLAEHVGDDPAHIAENRRRLAAMAGFPIEPAWLKQVHGTTVVDAETALTPVAADAAFTRRPGRPCVVMTADCLPVLFCDRAGTVVAAAHAGWRGLAGGVIAATVARMGVRPAELLAWLGPAIGPDAFEVGEEVLAAFLALDAGNAGCFRPSPAGCWLADLYELARRQLRGLGIAAIYGGDYCTFSEPERFFSYRRENRTGRMATLIWLE
ncbi:MAG TPA: peptidoglycan editing factor PgeF [Candidatus Competibacteraceae bacterium]|nr:peptidoglycan editing factor PgeF [Candidatus Competibacteraceae bacterium]HRZ05106.1 peptidoglycan editing factor PgeF [Candidatus Competibacteraceae bacterium]HSA46918.1 peptidoglycan editing factor PgeF [Candidatus Competibacteraceae bacterium]